jgi:peptidoglycan biosynthesis protein MviN/MurJ (putative lipid II flippase)
MPIWKYRIFEPRVVRRYEISPGLGRWWFIYVMPAVVGVLVVLVVLLALSDWLPRTLGIGLTNLGHLGLAGILVFALTYALLMWAVKREFRTQDSDFSE